MSDKTIGYIFVACQVFLLLALILPTTGNDWAIPAWLRISGFALVLAGLGLVGVASGKLGGALTATPMPNGRGDLKTDGLYGLVRHPIYSGVLIIVLGLVVRSGRFIVIAIGIATVSFFHTKAQWEERKLREHFAGYDAYAAVTPRFVPRLARVFGSDPKE